MKLHHNGTIEGTPEEIAQYNERVTEEFYRKAIYRKTLRTTGVNEGTYPGDSLEQQRLFGPYTWSGSAHNQITYSPEKALKYMNVVGKLCSNQQ